MTRLQVTPSSGPSPVKPTRLQPLQFWLIGGIVIAGALLRLASSSTDLWYEEVVSWKLATQTIHSPFQIFTLADARIGSNHPLNTLFMWILGKQSFWPTYRLLSFLTGTAAIALAARVMLRFGQWASVLAAALVAMSYPLVVYSSEAQGYAPMICFALLAFDSLEEYAERRNIQSIWVHNVAVILGLLSHPTFLEFYVAEFFWSVYLFQRGRSLGQAILDAMKLNIGPLLALAGLYLFFFRHVAFDPTGGQPLSVTLVSTLSMLIGGPETAVAATIAKYLCIVAAVAILASLDWVGPRRGEMLAFFIAVILVAPAIVYFAQFQILKSPDALAPKYFLIPLTFSLMLIALRLGAMMNRPGTARTICIVLISAMFIGNAWQIWELANHGRGDYSAAVEWMATKTEGNTITVTCNEDPPANIERTSVLLDFYKQISGGKTMQFIDPLKGTMTPPPQWLIVNTRITGRPVVDQIKPTENVRYTFDHSFDCFGLSGWTWQLFRLEPSASNP